MVALLIMALTIPLFAADELELGMSFTPLHMVAGGDNPEGTEPPPPTSPDMMYPEEKDFLDEWLIGFHFGYNTGILYASVDSFVMPPFLVEKMTQSDEYFEDTDQWVKNPGIVRPGFLNFLDLGIKLNISKFVLFAEAGVNNLYVYHQGDLPEEQKAKIGTLGTNIRFGASYRVINNLSVGLTGTAIFPNFMTMGNALKGLFGDEQYENSAEQVQLLPILMIVFYL
jgi:hypothetical protein